MAATHATAAWVLMALPAIPWWSKGLVLLALAASFYYNWRLHLSRTAAQAVQEIRYYAPDNILLRTNSHSHFVRLDGSSFLHPWLCVLNLRSQSGKLHTLILLPDNVPPDTLRQLRVRIKFSKIEQIEKTLP